MQSHLTITISILFSILAGGGNRCCIGAGAGSIVRGACSGSSRLQLWLLSPVASRLPLHYFLHWKRGLVKLIPFARHPGSLSLWERPCGSTPTALASVTVAQQCSGRPTVSERRRSFGELLSARKCAD